jgi:hypothetical protein
MQLNYFEIDLCMYYQKEYYDTWYKLNILPACASICKCAFIDDNNNFDDSDENDNEDVHAAQMFLENG